MSRHIIIHRRCEAPLAARTLAAALALFLAGVLSASAAEAGQAALNTPLSAGSPRPASATASTRKATATALPSDAFFDGSAVQDVYLTLKPEDWDTLRANFMSDDYYPADLQWNGQTVATIGIKSRGSGSRNPFKPGLKVDFAHYKDQKFLGLKSFVLLNGVQDPSMIRQRLGMLVFDRMNEPAPRATHARLFINGQYLGLYQMMESPDKTFLGRVLPAKADGKVENDGYFYEYLGKTDYAWDYLGPDYAIYQGLFEAKTHESDAPADLWGPMVDTFKAISEFSLADDQTYDREVGRFVDLAKFAHYLGVDTCTSDIDGFLGDWGPNNFYYYRYLGQPNARLFPWDKDMAFYAWDAPLFTHVDTNVMAARVLAMPTYYRIYATTVMTCGAMLQTPDEVDPSMGWLEAEVRRERAQITQAAYADQVKRFPDERFDDELNKLINYSQRRGNFLVNEAIKALDKLNARQR
jgi:spore coat protein CotH